MSSIIEDILPTAYFSADSLLGVQADQRVLCQLVSILLPRLHETLQMHDVGKPNYVGFIGIIFKYFLGLSLMKYLFNYTSTPTQVDYQPTMLREFRNMNEIPIRFRSVL